MNQQSSRWILVTSSLCVHFAIAGCSTPPEAPKQLLVEAPIEEPTPNKVDRPNPIAPNYPAQSSSNTKSGSVATPDNKTNASDAGSSKSGGSGKSGSGSRSGSGSGSGSGKSGSGSGSGTGSGSGSGKSGSGSGSGTGSGMSAGTGSGSGSSPTGGKSAAAKPASAASSSQTGAGQSSAASTPASTSGTKPTGTSQSAAKGEVDGAGKANGNSSKDFFSETPPAAATAAGSATKNPANQTATTASKELDFSKVAPTEAPLPNSKPIKEDSSAAILVLPFRGCWRQVDCDEMNSADFALGGYSQRYLMFNEGQGEMRVYCGFGESAKQRIAIRYRFISKGDGLMSIEPAPGAAAALELIPTGATPPTSLTANVTWTLTPDGARMMLSGKNYVRVSDSEGRAFATGEKISNMPVAAAKSTTTLFALPWIEGDTLIIFDAGQSAESRSNALSALRNAFREQLQGRRAILISLNSDLPLNWAAAGTSLLMKQVATAESSAAQPLTTSRLSDLFRNVPSIPTRILVISGSGFSPSDIADLMKKRTWTCPVDVVVTGSANADDWQKFASATGGKVAP